MRRASHMAMGRFLLREYLPGISGRNARLFLLGCVQPDQNPTTYLKGSVRSQWMQGHNYGNASRFINRLANRLERKDHFSGWDYYSLGKLVHYILDAFTYPHNVHYDAGLSGHHGYEVLLQDFFLEQLPQLSAPYADYPDPAVGLIRRMHRDYMELPGRVETDTAFAFAACCLLTQRLTENLAEHQKTDSLLSQMMV